MASEQQVDVIVGKLVEAQVVSQGHDYVLDWNVAGSASVEDFECVEEVEIWFQGYFDLGTLQLSLKEYVLFEDLCELRLLDSVVVAESSIARQDLRLKAGLRASAGWAAASQGTGRGPTDSDVLLLGWQCIVTCRQIRISSSWTLISEWWLPTPSQILQISHSAIEVSWKCARLSSATSESYLLVSAILWSCAAPSWESSDVLDLVGAVRHARISHVSPSSRSTWRAVAALHSSFDTSVWIITGASSTCSRWPLLFLFATRFENRCRTTVHAGSSRLVPHRSTAVHPRALSESWRALTPPRVGFAPRHFLPSTGGTPRPFLLQRLVSQLHWLRCRKLRLDGLPELTHVDFSITIEVEPPKNRHYFLFTRQMAHTSQKPLEVLFVDIVVIPVVDGFESSPHAEVVTGLKGPFDILGLQVHSNLLIDQLTHGSFNPHRQELVGI